MLDVTAAAVTDTADTAAVGFGRCCAKQSVRELEVSLPQTYMDMPVHWCVCSYLYLHVDHLH